MAALYPTPVGKSSILWFHFGIYIGRKFSKKKKNPKSCLQPWDLKKQDGGPWFPDLKVADHFSDFFCFGKFSTNIYTKMKSWNGQLSRWCRIQGRHLYFLKIIKVHFLAKLCFFCKKSPKQTPPKMSFPSIKTIPRLSMCLQLAQNDLRYFKGGEW